MRVLIWTPPWPVHGDPQFFRNAFVKHLCLQANTLAGFADEVSVALPAHFADEAAVLDAHVAVFELPLSASRPPAGLTASLYQSLYANNDDDLVAHFVEQLRPSLPADVDVILQWENPVPFLQNLYPEALIINQMPGAFSRPPYPHTVTFDPIGLYRDGAMHLHAGDIQRGRHLSDPASQFGRDFTTKTQAAMDCFDGVCDILNEKADAFEQTALLPLQASKHYAFAIDSGFDNQLDMMWSVLEKTPEQTGVIVTQYRNGLVADTPLDPAVAAPFHAAFPHLIYDERFEKIASVSQYMLPYVDRIISASSSLGVQGMVWRNKLEVIGNTFLSRYATDAPDLADMSWAQRCENTIATLITRHQPLATAVTEDGAFLMNLLTEMRSRKAGGAQGLDMLPEFTAIDPKYNERLLQDFRIERSARALAVSPVPNLEAETLVRLQGLIDDPQTKVVSFDVFDTLICRSVEKPADLYRFLETDALALTDGIAVGFGQVRALCEVQTRARLEASKEEITLADIYETVAQYYGMTEEQLAPLREAEMRCEIEHARVRPFGQKLFNLAKASGKPVNLISDMYLPHDTITQMLEKAGYAGQYATLFLSCDYDRTKKTGALYPIVLDQLGIQPRALVHIGDNKQTDILMAEAHGIRAFRWSSSIDWMRENAAYKSAFSPRIGAGEKARSAVAGTTARALFDAPLAKTHHTSLSGGNAYRLGHAVLGPLTTGYMLWLGREAKRDNVSDLFFMAREGWVLKEVFDALHPPGPDTPKTHYLLGSRRAVRVAACRTPADVMALLAMPYDPGVPLAALIEGRFGLAFKEEDMSRLAASGVNDRHVQLDRSFEHRQMLCTVVHAYMDDILAHAERERRSYMAFLQNEGFMDAKLPAIVDVGWKTNIQGALGDLTERRTTGYYYATVQDSELWINRGDKHRGYVGVALSGGLSKSVAVQNRHLVEFMLCHSSRSLVAIKDGENGLLPVYRKEAELAKRRRLIDPMHRGTIAYAQAFRNGFSRHFDQIYIDPNLAETTLAGLITDPQRADAELFVGQCFEDAVGGVAEKFVIAPSPTASPSQSVWRQGAEAIHGDPSARGGKRPPKVKPQTAEPKMEAFMVKRIASERKRAKYERDRAAFFADSQKQLVRLYWKAVGGQQSWH